MPKVYLYVDASDLSGLCSQMADRLTADNFDRLMRRTLNEVGKRSKKPIKDAVKTQYEAPSGWIGRAIKPSVINGGGLALQCVIPLQGSRGANKSVFPAGGQRSKGHIPKGKRYKVWLRDVKGVNSQLPYHMDAYGGQPPFINGGPAVMTRKGKARGPLSRVVGLALPQMPLNRAEPETAQKILNLCEERLVHNFSNMFGGL